MTFLEANAGVFAVPRIATRLTLPKECLGPRFFPVGNHVMALPPSTEERRRTADRTR
jgi:hypothetical protein